MSGGGGGGRNKRLEALQTEVLEQELADRDKLDEEDEARKRLRLAGGFRQQLRFRGPGRVTTVNRSPRPKTTAPRAATVVVPRPTTDRGGVGAGGRGGQGGAAGGGSGAGAGGTGDSGGVGCFLPGTLVTLAAGIPPAIEHVKVGDVVASFDNDGRRTSGEVIGCHAFRRDDGYLVITHKAGSLAVTKAHRIMTPSGFKEAGEFRIGDAMVAHDGTEWPVENTEWHPGAVTVHNLTIKGDPHYIAGGIRVHNVKHDGGFVEGPEEAGDILEVIQQGEVVMSRDAVKLVGRAHLEALNRKAKRAKEARAA